MHMNITSGLRRTSSPTAPIENSSADSSRYQVGSIDGDHASLTTVDVRPSATGRGQRRVTSTVPVTATISSTDASSRANT